MPLTNRCQCKSDFDVDFEKFLNDVSVSEWKKIGLILLHVIGLGLTVLLIVALG